MNSTSTGNILNGIATATPNKYKYCPNCGRSNYESFKYCPDCGEKLSRGISTSPTWYPHHLSAGATTLEHRVYPSAVQCSGNTLESAYDSQYTSAVAKPMHYPAE